MWKFLSPIPYNRKIQHEYKPTIFLCLNNGINEDILSKFKKRSLLHIPAHPPIWIARVIGIIAIAIGFVFGIEGLNQPNSLWLPTALVLILTGLCAQVYAFYRTITYKIQPEEKKDS